jgi:TPR repeat protein
VKFNRPLEAILNDNYEMMLKFAICLTLTAFLCLLIMLPLSAGACGWWGDAGIDDNDDSILVDTDYEPDADVKTRIIDPAAQTREGDRYRTGSGVARNYIEAVYWYRRAAMQGFAGGQNNFAVMYEKGLGISKNKFKAAMWFRKAAEQQDASAQHALGRMYRDGEGVPRNFEEAAKWISRAAEQGHHGAFRHMGEMYWKGLGVSQNNVQAYMWWKLGVLYGDKSSEGPLSMAASKMNSDSVAEAEKLAQEWLQK